jgi:predicted membrane-bound dolichyl-phosphate-mannose-protein mannosyltransferase
LYWQTESFIFFRGSKLRDVGLRRLDPGNAGIIKEVSMKKVLCTMFLFLTVAVVSCTSIQEEQELMELASANGRYIIAIVYKNGPQDIVGIERRGMTEVGEYDTYLTYYYRFDGRKWSKCERPADAPSDGLISH